jgi:hypothetical protein
MGGTGDGEEWAALDRSEAAVVVEAVVEAAVVVEAVVAAATEVAAPAVGPRIDAAVGPGVGPAVGPAVGPRIDAAVGPAGGPAVGPGIDAAVGPSVGPGVGPAEDPAVGPVAPAVGLGVATEDTETVAAAANFEKSDFREEEVDLVEVPGVPEDTPEMMVVSDSAIVVPTKKDSAMSLADLRYFAARIWNSRILSSRSCARLSWRSMSSWMSDGMEGEDVIW